MQDVFLKVAEETIAHRSETEGNSTAKSKSIAGSNLHPKTNGGNTGDSKNGAAIESLDEVSAVNSGSNSHIEAKNGVDLHNGKHTSILSQTFTMIRKRITILQRGYLPTVAAIIIPIVAAGITMVTFSGFKGVSCNSATQISIGDFESFKFTPDDFNITVGPRDRFGLSQLQGIAELSLPSDGANSNFDLSDSLHYVDTLDQFNQYIKTNFMNVTPGGIFLGSDSATYAYKADDGLSVRGPLSLQNVVNNLAYNITGGIASQYQTFDFIWPAGQGDTLIFTVYFGLAFAAFPAFFALYPTVERLRKVRALHFSNGVRALPLWLAYTIFDFVAVILISVVCAIIFSASTSGWYHLGYLVLWRCICENTHVDYEVNQKHDCLHDGRKSKRCQLAAGDKRNAVNH